MNMKLFSMEKRTRAKKEGAMTRILIVDDETLVRIGIKSMVDWESYGFSIVGEADNGKSGYEMAKKLKPDIVLTDIKMPCMDGLELLRLLKKENLCMGVIILSAYSDFPYVKKALKYGADDYILKVDLEEDSLISLLLSLGERIDERKSAHKRNQMEEQLYSENMEFLQSKFLKDLIEGQADKKQTEEQLDLLGISLEPQYLRCISVELKGGSFFNQGKLGSKQEEQRIHKTLLNLLLEVTRNYPNLYAADMGMFEYILVSGTEAQRERSYFAELAGHIRSLAEKYINTDVVIGIGDSMSGYERLPECAKQAMSASEYAVVGQLSPVVFFEDVSDVDLSADDSLETATRQLETDLSKMDIAQVTASVGNIIDVVQANPRMKTEQVREYWHIIAYMFRKFQSNIQNTVRQNAGQAHIAAAEKLEWVLSKKPRDHHDFLQNLAALRSVAKELIKPSKSSPALVHEIKEYIDENYQKPLQLENIATQFSISSNYLCRVYKKITGQSVLEYVTQQRIEEAKYLLQTTNTKIKDISQLVGYENIYYFSKVFKKVTGESPAAFRESH